MSSSLSLALLLAVPLAPLLGAAVTGVFGTAMGGRLLGRRSCHSITILGVAIAFALSLQTLLLTSDGARLNATVYSWMTVGSLRMEVGFLVDNLTAMMMVVVTFVALMVHIYTIGYMHEDEGYNRFFSYISLFTFAMLMLVMSNNFLQLFFGWEAVGLVSYLLIGFWYKKPTAIFANMKAFLVNRVGDFGFILGIGLIVTATGSFAYTEVFAQVDKLAVALFPHSDWQLITVACICLFVGAMGKSAQFPLHVWLPDSMEGPTPISALIHAATMVTAGIFMVARMSPLYELSDVALNLIMIVGAITAFFMGLLGVIQNDIKRVVAYSTLSQLGYMTVALGASAYSVAVFHLMTHAFFKALLFLGAGSVIVGMHHDQDIRNMGGLRRYLPITWITSLLGSLALIGTPLFSGFYSKDSILEAVHASNLAAAPMAWWALFIGVFITAFYSFRMYFLVFHGPERFRHKPFASPHEHHGHAHEPHESPWVITLPLILLAIPSVMIGWVTVQPMLHGRFFADAIAVSARHPAMAELQAAFHGPGAMAQHALLTPVFGLVLAGVALAWVLYIQLPEVPAKLAKVFRPIMVVMENKYFFDWLNENIVARGARLLGAGLWNGGDRLLIDGFVVNGAWRAAGALAKVVRRLQTGQVYHYALIMLVGVLLMLSAFLWSDFSLGLSQAGGTR